VIVILRVLVEIWLLALIARALLSWFQTGGEGLARVNHVLAVVTEPVLKPVRSVIKPIRVGGTYLDLSILVVFLVVQIVVLRLLS
jgi:YggT family protein